jgi:uncharacterized protein (DUF2147 family)
MRVFFSIILLTCFSLFRVASITAQTNRADAILGDWMTTDNKLKVHVYKENGEFKATISWFEDAHYKCKMSDCTDEMNPDPNLRSRKILGMQVLSQLVYDSTQNIWTNGKIYDSNSGDTYDSMVAMQGNDKLFVRGYYLFEWLGRTMEFYRV